MEKFRVYGATTKEESDRERLHKALVRRAATEGFVLLKNDGVMPLAPTKIALFGGGSCMTVKGGSGSGEVNERHSVTIEEGLRNAGFTFNTLWMDRYEKKYRKDIDDWREGVNRAIKGYGPIRTMKMFDVINSLPKPFPSCTPVLDDELDDAETAIYVLSRQAGEGHDRKCEKGDYLLSDVEADGIKKLSAHYKKFILVLNCGGVIDLSILDTTRVDAVLYYAQGGMEGGNAFADVLTGKVTPSGKLTDTWAREYKDYPCGDTFSYINGNLDEDEYKEGIFVGYRYFSTFGVKPRFPFGFGLSYAEFERKFKGAALDKTTFSIVVEVTNAGKLYSGKDVVQVYIHKPCGGISVEKLSLAAFAKTKLLYPTQSDELTLSFDVRDMSVYDEKSHSFVLNKGKYGVYFGSSVDDNELCCAIEVNESVTVEKTSTIVKKKPSFTEFTHGGESETYGENLPCFTVKAEDIKTVTHREYVPEFSDKVKKILNRLSDKQKAMLVVGGAYKLKSFNAVMGAAGRTNTELLKAGIPNIIMSDGPAGLNVVQSIVVLKSGAPRFPDGVPEMWQWGWLKKFGFIAKAKPSRGRPVYRYMTAFPSETLLAQSWDIKLMEEVGEAVGREMREIGVSVWLAPGMNIHRNPLCGRNFEYYSEDPYVSGKMAAAITRGIQSCGGVGVAIKHFCCNNQEDNRMMVSENVTERAMREIYLRGFRIAIEESDPWTVMSCYNRVNGKHVCNTKDLLTGVLRDEWGFKGLVMSDWSATDQCSYSEAINSGNDLIMPGNKGNVKALLEALKEGKLDKKALDISVCRVLTMIFNSATCEGF